MNGAYLISMIQSLLLLWNSELHIKKILNLKLNLNVKDTTAVFTAMQIVNC